MGLGMGTASTASPLTLSLPTESPDSMGWEALSFAESPSSPPAAPWDWTLVSTGIKGAANTLQWAAAAAPVLLALHAAGCAAAGGSNEGHTLQ